MDRGRKLKAHTSELRKQVTIISQKWRKWLYVVQCFHIIQCFHIRTKTGKNESKTKIYLKNQMKDEAHAYTENINWIFQQISCLLDWNLQQISIRYPEPSESHSVIFYVKF